MVLCHDSATEWSLAGGISSPVQDNQVCGSFCVALQDPLQVEDLLLQVSGVTPTIQDGGGQAQDPRTARKTITNLAAAASRTETACECEFVCVCAHSVPAGEGGDKNLN